MSQNTKVLIFLLFFLFALRPLPARAEEHSASEVLFPRPSELESSVEFWKLVFTQHGKQQIIFHDRRDPGIVYRVVTLPHENTRRRTVRRIVAREKNKILREYKFKRRERRKIRAQRGIKERFVGGVQRSQRYLDQMKEIFEAEGLPVELAYLPLIESSFVNHAHSRKGAVGIWQFIRSTGRRYMRVGRAVDERRDPLESTRAAARLLAENYEIFGNWPLAITAYNYGREGLLRAVRKVGSRDLIEIIDRHKARRFGFASRNFYAEFLAVLDIMDQKEILFPELEYEDPFPMAELELEKAVSIASLTKQAGVSRAEFLEWNPALSKRLGYLPKGYRVKMPPDMLESFELAYQGIIDTPWIGHRVSPGETLSEIAAQYKVSLFHIQEANALSSPHRIVAGQLLRIPSN